MKKIMLGIMIVLLALFAFGCASQSDLPKNNTQVQDATQKISSEERKKMDLYVTVMKAAFQEENGGNSFVAVKLDTLEGLSDVGKKEVLKELADLSPNVYNYEEVKDDTTKFEYDEKIGLRVRAIDGTLLYMRLKEYNGDKAVIEGVSWFGALGAVFPEYKATYENGKWKLDLISMAIS